MNHRAYVSNNLSQKTAVTKLRRRQRVDVSGYTLTFLVEIEASEAEEENRPSPTASISRGGFRPSPSTSILRSLVTRSTILAPDTFSDHTRKFVALSTMML
jgi:hypothetical protein